MKKQTSIQRALSLRKSLSARRKQRGSAKKRILIILLILLAAAMLLLPVIMWLSHVMQKKINASSNDTLLFGPGTEADIDDLKARHVQRLDVLTNEYDERAGKATMEDGPINNRFFDNGDNDE